MSFDPGVGGDRASDGPSEPGSDQLVVSDPEVMRALAHPLRLAILRHLRTVGSATASDLEAVVNASASLCSFHLRALAHAGLVEEDDTAAPGGRRRPWRAVPVRLAWQSGSGDRHGDRAAEDLFEVLSADVAAARRWALDHDSEYPEVWRSAIGADHVVVSVTAEELARLRWAIRSLLEGVQRSGRSKPATGAERVDVVVDYVPGFRPHDGPAAGVSPTEADR
ncbi:MAG: ArsR/SmtB family transcription factor [Acidimicrobiales bacterium]